MLNKYSKNEIKELNQNIDTRISLLKENEVIAFTDGSYNKETRQSGFGVIIIHKTGHNIQEICLHRTFYEIRHKKILSIKNVGAEIEAVKSAIEWAIYHNKNRITIYYDYEGIEKWAKMIWSFNNDITHDYVAFILDKSNHMEIIFQKIPAHSGVLYNEKADKLAKKSAKKKDKKVKYKVS